MPIIERKETSVGLRLHYHAATESVVGKPLGLDVRLDPQGVLNLESPFLHTAAERLGITVGELVEQLNQLEVGKSIEWE